MEENLKNKLIEEALKVDDSEMFEDADIPLPEEIGFANDLYDLISGLYSGESDLKESLPLFKKKYLLIDKDISGPVVNSIWLLLYI